MFTDGEYVLYISGEICRIGGKEKRSFDGIHTVEYIKLLPQCSSNSAYYIPADTLESKVRSLISRSDIYSIIDRLPQIEEKWDADNAKRKEMFGNFLKSDDYDKIFCVAKSVYSRQKNLEKGRKLSSFDEWALKTAENIISQEFSVVLGMQPEDVGTFISKRLETCDVLVRQQ